MRLAPRWGRELEPRDPAGGRTRGGRLWNTVSLKARGAGSITALLKHTQGTQWEFPASERGGPGHLPSHCKSQKMPARSAFELM